MLNSLFATAPRGAPSITGFVNANIIPRRKQQRSHRKIDHGAIEED